MCLLKYEFNPKMPLRNILLKLFLSPFQWQPNDMHLRTGRKEPGHDTKLRGLHVESDRAVLVSVLPSAQSEPGLWLRGPNGGRVYSGRKEMMMRRRMSGWLPAQPAYWLNYLNCLQLHIQEHLQDNSRRGWSLLLINASQSISVLLRILSVCVPFDIQLLHVQNATKGGKVAQ